MKAILSFVLAIAFTWSGAAGELKVGTLDLQKVLADYYKAQEASKLIKERQSSFLKELETLRLEGLKLSQEAEVLRGLSGDNALSAAAREETRKKFELKVTDLRAFEVRYDDLRAQREAELQSQMTQTNKRILADVLSMTRFVGEKEGFNLILNANKANPAASDVLFARGLDDLTDKVVTSLNAARPTADPVRPESKDGKPQ